MIAQFAGRYIKGKNAQGKFYVSALFPDTLRVTPPVRVSRRPHKTATAADEYAKAWARRINKRAESASGILMQPRKSRSTSGLYFIDNDGNAP